MTDSGQAETLRTLFRENYQILLAYAIRRTGGFEDAQDVVSEVFSVAWRRIEDIPESSDRRRMWLFGVAHRVMANRRRTYRRYWRLVDRVAASDRSESSVDELEGDGVALALRALELLSPEDQELILLSVWEELSHSAVAEILGVSTANVSVRLHRAKQRLRDAYDRVTQGPTLSSRVAESTGSAHGHERRNP